MKRYSSIFRKMAIAVFSLMVLSGCGKAVVEHDHIWDEGEITTAATCHSEGLKTFHCTVEGCDQTKTENLSMTPHNWDEGRITKAPTCQEHGIKTFSCQNEGCDKTKTEKIAKLDHQFEEGEIVKIPDLLTKGERELICEICSETAGEEIEEHVCLSEQFGTEAWNFGYMDNYVPGQDYIEPSLIEYHDGRYSHDGVIFTQDYVQIEGDVGIAMYQIPSNAEKIKVSTNISFIGSKENTRLSSFLVLVNPDNGEIVKEIKVSQNSKDWEYDNQEGIDLIKDFYLCVIFINNGEETASGKVSITYKAKCVHIWDEGRITKEATYDEEGIREYNCIVCQEKYDEAIEKLVREPIAFVNNVTFFHRFDNKDGDVTIELESNAWLTNNGHDAHVEVTKKCNDAWRAGMQLDTGVALLEGHTYEVAFTATIKDELLEGEQYGFILQPKRWAEISERLDYLTSPSGRQTITLDIKKELLDDQKIATLWFLVEMGNIENEITISNVLVIDKGLTPVDPDPSRFNFNGKIIDRFEEGVVGETWTSDFGHVAHIKVTTPHASEVFRGGAFINTGIELKAEKTYEISFTTNRVNSTPFELILQNRQWEEFKYHFFDSPIGNTVYKIQTSEFTKGSLWILIQFGTTVNEITISDLVVNETGPANPFSEGTLDFANRIEGRFDKDGDRENLDGEVGLIDNGKGAYLEIKTACKEKWAGGMFIDTGFFLEEGEYTISFDSSRTNKGADYNLLLRYAQWGDDAFITGMYGLRDGSLGADFTVNDKQTGYLWLYVESGDLVNKISISNLIVTPKDETYAGQLNFTGRAFDRFSDGVEGSLVLINHGHGLSIIISTPQEGKIYAGGATIIAANNIATGKYKLTFTSQAIDRTNPFNFIIGSSQYGNQYGGKWDLGDGTHEIEFNVTSSSDLWFAVECGTSTGTLNLFDFELVRTGDID